jgi:hypothetical protein
MYAGQYGKYPQSNDPKIAKRLLKVSAKHRKMIPAQLESDHGGTGSMLRGSAREAGDPESFLCSSEGGMVTHYSTWGWTDLLKVP